MSRPARRIWVYSTAGSVGVHLALVAIALTLAPRLEPAQAKTEVSIARLAVDRAAPVPGSMVTSMPATLAVELVTPSAAMVTGVQASVAALAPSTAQAVASIPTNAVAMLTAPSVVAPLQPAASQRVMTESVKPLAPRGTAPLTAMELAPAQEPAASVVAPRIVALASPVAPGLPAPAIPAEALKPRLAAVVPSVGTVATKPSAPAAIVTPGSVGPSTISASPIAVLLPIGTASTTSTLASLPAPVALAISPSSATAGSIVPPIEAAGIVTPTVPGTTVTGSTLAPVPPLEMASIPQAPVPPVETPAQLGENVRAFVATYQGTPCLAAEVSVAENSADVTAFGSAEASGRFASALKAAFPDRVAALTTVISPDQCAAASMLSQWQNSPGVGADIDVAEAMVENGANVEANIAFAGGAWVTVLLIDDDGKVTDLNDHLALVDGKVALTAPVVAVGAGAGTSQLLLAVTSSKELETLHSPFGGQASELLPKLLEELNRTGTHAAIAMASFKVYGAGMTLK